MQVMTCQKSRSNNYDLLFSDLDIRNIAILALGYKVNQVNVKFYQAQNMYGSFSLFISMQITSVCLMKSANDAMIIEGQHFQSGSWVFHELSKR